MVLRHRVSSGIKWASVSLVLIRATRFATGVVLARLLAPQMFGIVAMATVAVETIGVLRHVGVGAAYIYRHFPNQEEKRLAENTIFLVVFAVACLLFGATFFAAPLLAGFFRYPEVVLVLRVMALSFLIEPFASVPNFILLKELRFERQAYCEIVQAGAYAAAGIPLALAGAGVWSLVGGLLASRCGFAVAALASCRWRPQLRFSAALVRRLFGYGKFLWFGSIITAVGEALDKAVIGRLWGAAVLGHYQIAFSVARLPAGIAANMCEKISFPAFSTLKRTRDRLAGAFVRAAAQLAALILPGAMLLSVVAEDFVLSVYGPKWKETADFIRVLAFFGFFQCMVPVPSNLLKAMGYPGLLLGVSIYYHVLFVALLFFFRAMGALGVCYALLASAGCTACAAFAIAQRKLQFSMREFAEPVLRSAVCAAAAAGGAWLFRESVTVPFAWPAASALCCACGLGGLLYFAVSYCLNRSLLREVARSVRDILRSKRSREAEPEPVGVSQGASSSSERGEKFAEAGR